MNSWNSPLLEIIAETGEKTRISGAEEFRSFIPLVAEVLSELTNCFGLLELTVLGGTFFCECKPHAISVE